LTTEHSLLYGYKTGMIKMATKYLNLSFSQMLESRQGWMPEPVRHDIFYILLAEVIMCERKTG